MENENNFLQLQDTFNQLWGELNALDLMVLGLSQAGDPYVKGFGMICSHFREIMEEMQQCLEQFSSNQD